MINIQQILYTGLIIVFTCLSTLATAKDTSTQTSLKDPGVINKERILYWLTKRGEIKADASEVEKKQILTEYLKRTKNGAYRLPPVLAKYEARLQRKQKEQTARLKVVATKSAENTTVKILAVLIDFPDLPYTEHQLTSADTDMYYENYPASHYSDMIFSTTGYTGPSAQTLTTAYQYYLEESGSTFFLEGQVEGWVRADNNAATYGANDPDDDDGDMDVSTLVKEAVDKAIAAGNINLADFDHEDQYDLDRDGNVNEPDGIIDHVMIFHSSVGEEAGGGVLGDDAIWSHSFSVDASTIGYSLTGTQYQQGVEYKLLDYTIQPIDAAIGVVVHEFGHDLGVSDEYNTNDSDSGSPVGFWSLMASGSWAGNPSGTQPSGFSPLTSNYFQQKFNGNWNNTNIYSVSGLSASAKTIVLSEATNHDAATNLIKVEVPAALVDFFPPYTGTYQYYSGSGHYINNAMSFSLDIPVATTVELKMKAHWNIEVDYDYARLLINDVAIAGNHTKVNNQYKPAIHNFVTDISANIAGAEGDEGWVDLIFDVSAYQGQTVTVTIEYVTDPNTGDYGIAIDDISLVADSVSTYFDGAEYTPGPVTFNGFTKIESSKPTLTQNYWVQMRSYNGVDAGLNPMSYQRGMLVWFEDPNYSENHVDVHPGHGFIGVVDAGQEIVINGLNPASTNTQIRDATFSLNDSADSSVFNDSDDYSTPEQPFSGMVLPRHGLSFTIQSQELDSSEATILFEVTEVPWRSEFTYAKDFRTVSFTNTSFGTGNAAVEWDFGDGSPTSSEWSPTYTYQSSGNFTVTLTVTTEADGSIDVSNQTFTIAELLTASFDATENNGVVSFEASVSGGETAYSYSWDFGDNSATGIYRSLSHTYTSSGDYSVVLTVTSADNQTAISTQLVAVSILPIAGYTVTANNLTASFTNTTTGGDGNITYAWDFGDGSTSTETSPGHTYTSAGTYTVTLTVTDGQTNTDTYSTSVTVSDPPAPPQNDSGGGGSFGFLLPVLLLIRKRFSR